MRIYPFLMPPAYPDYNLPPTLYSILESIVNYGKDEKTKIKDLASAGRSKIFDFDYPLTENISKEDFECMILNHFIMRRIGYDTMTAFKIALEVKLNEVMPIYNKMFDMLEGWDLFNDGETITRSYSESGENSIDSNSTSIMDNRYSDTPQNKLVDVQDGTYMTDYTYNTGNNTTESSASDSRLKEETIRKTPSDKIRIYKEFINNNVVDNFTTYPQFKKLIKELEFID